MGTIMNKDLYQSTLLAILTVLALVLLALLLLPVAEPFAWALIIGISTIPHYNRLSARLPRRRSLSAFLMVMAVTICVILPLGVLLYLVAQNAVQWYHEAVQAADLLKKSGTAALGQLPFLDRIQGLLSRFGVDLSGLGAKLAGGVSQYTLEGVKGLAQNVANLLFILVLTIFILFFVYRDGEKMVDQALTLFPGNRARRIVSDLRATMTSVTVGTLFTCLAQGITAGLGYWVADVPAPFLFGALTAFAALLPVVGTGFVWVPLVLLVVIKGSVLKAGLLALWCVIFVGLADNAIRPLAIGATSDIPVPVVVLGAICGVFTLGLLGLILGPVVLALVVTLWKDAVHPQERLGKDAGGGG